MPNNGDNDDDNKPPRLTVVSDNPSARADRQIDWAKEQVERALAEFAAALLRTMAGSDTEAIYLIRRLSHFVDALNKFREELGRGLTVAEFQEALRLPRSDRDFSHSDDWAYRHWLREHGLDVIVQGALRLAAHKVLDERPHFGGKYSEEVIEAGIRTLEELKRGPPTVQSQTRKKVLAANWDDLDLGPAAQRTTSESAPQKPSLTRGSKRALGQSEGFGPDDLKELRKAIKAKDDKRIAELTAKISRPSFEGPK